MRAFKPEVAKKNMKDARFFEYFKDRGGVNRATTQEIRDKLMLLFKDLIFGNVVQDKYMEAIMGEPRIMQEAIIFAEANLMENHILVQSMDCAIQCRLPSVLSLPTFDQIYTKYTLRATTYGTILAELKNFVMSGNPEYLVAISVKLNSPFMRGVKQQYML